MTRSVNSSNLNTKRPVALIPCAGNPPMEMQAEFGVTPTALLPMGRSVALMELISRLSEHCGDIYVGLKSIPPAVELLVARQYPQVHLVPIEHSNSIGETVMALAHAAQAHQGPIPVYVQFGDSLQEFEMAEKTTFFYSISSHSYKWISFDLVDEKFIQNIQVPTKDKEHIETPKKIFTGQFYFDDPKAFFSRLQKSIDEKGLFDPFLRACADLAQTETVHFEPKDMHEWQDFGYLSSYHECRRQMVMNAREFNSIHFDRKKNTITKRSKNVEKFLGEIRWFKSLPPQLAYIHPRVYAIDDAPQNPMIELEYLPSIPLDQLYLYGSAELFTWRKINSHVQSAVQEMRSFEKKDFDVTACCRDMYVKKTKERILEYVKKDEFALFRNDSVKVNGQEVGGLNTVIETLDKYVERFLVQTAPTFGVIHGDLCFSNILYDVRLEQIKLIDPRGSFGKEGVYGDPRYDLAKLRHSAVSSYDFLVHGLFTLKTNKDGVELSIPRTRLQEQISRYFDELIKGIAGDRYLEIVLIESLLFLSMVPLHNDRPEAQKAYVATGLTLFDQFLREAIE